MQFLAQVAGVKYQEGHVSREEIERARVHHKHLERAAWIVRDEELRLFSYYRDGLHRSDRLLARLNRARDADTKGFWERAAQLAPAQTFFLAAYIFMCRASRETISRFVLASNCERREMILDGSTSNEQRAAA
jgi:hypothetical protein